MIVITGGEMAGRRLKKQHSALNRPTSQKVREALFDILGEKVVDASFLDLCAGVGTVGIEAISRGCHEAMFVEKDPVALRLLADNLDALNISGMAKIWRGDVLGFLKKYDGKFDIIFMDPPYSSSLVEKIIKLIDLRELLAGCGELVVEHYYRSSLPDELGALKLSRTEKYGDTKISFFRGINY